MTFGEKVQALRKENGWSQEQLASMITVSRQALSKWELGTAIPDTENIMQLSRLFGVSIDYLLYDEYTSDNDVPIAKDIRSNISNTNQGKALLIVAIVMAGIGALGNLILWLLSTTVFLQVPNVPVLDGTDTTFTSDIWRKDYLLYLEYYHLEAVAITLWCLLAAGLVLLGIWILRKSKAGK